MLPALQAFVTVYGYPALSAGVFLEGETVLATAGFLARRGYFTIPWVIAVAACGTFLYAQIFYHIGWRWNEAVYRRWPRLRKGTDRIEPILKRHNVPITIGFRFLYGMKTVTPLALGIGHYGRARFAVLNALGAVVWSSAIILFGYGFGQILEFLIKDLKKYDTWVALAIVVAGTVYWMYRRRASAESGKV